ncbi:hypothetical protein BTJ39_12850 [Izhakiella australiensis]|uniref:DUF7661 domain-containing protein n=1 Tax=Izhakiella australiensis TaxID=1926881 RepID=A0A1S8YKD0_9GAMM|nr:hypothetical protein [Izhakiella australiensis]OON39539.1 hypothetical protein BTJ39_12850 [Izhakiella australiensis]
MQIYDVFGRYIGVKSTPDGWQVFRVDISERKFSRLYEVVIPDDVSEDQIVRWLDDIYHESASDKHPQVKRIE